MLWLMDDVDGSFVEGYSIYYWVHKKSAFQWYISYEVYAIFSREKKVVYVKQKSFVGELTTQESFEGF